MHTQQTDPSTSVSSNCEAEGFWFWLLGRSEICEDLTKHSDCQVKPKTKS